MITSLKALDIGYSALRKSPDLDKPGDIVVELVKSEYRVRFFSVISEDRSLDHLSEAFVDSESGKVLKVEDKGRVAGLQGRSADHDWSAFLSSKRACDLSVAALHGFESYDKHGRFTVELRKDVYYVTFPLANRAKLGSRAPDFATQVHIDARSGKVLKVLVAS